MTGENIQQLHNRLAKVMAERDRIVALCARHGVCTLCGEYYTHHYTEPFATCECGTSEWYKLTEHMLLQQELAKLREENAVSLEQRNDHVKGSADATTACIEHKQVVAEMIEAGGCAPAVIAAPVTDVSRETDYALPAAVRRFLYALDRYNELDKTVGGGWSTKKVGSTGQLTLAACDVRTTRKTLEGLLPPPYRRS